MTNLTLEQLEIIRESLKDTIWMQSRLDRRYRDRDLSKLEGVLQTITKIIEEGDHS